MKMKAAVYYGPGDIRIEEIERPRPGEEGMLVKVGACGICELIDMPHYKMDFPLKDVPAHYDKDLSPNKPIVLGHEFSGEVVEVGSKVTIAKPGDKVYGILYEPCGICSACQAGNPDECKYVDGGGRTINGAMAEYALFPKVTLESYKEDKLVKIPDSMSYRDGALIEVLVLSFGLSNKAKESDTVLVFGQDLMGLGITAHLKKRGVAKVITCDISEKRLQASKEMGADVVVNTRKENILDIVLEETKGRGVDIVLETSCRSESLQQAVTAVRPFGKIWLATSYTEGPFYDPTWQGPGMVSMNLTMKMGISLRCAWGTLGPWLPRMHEAIEMIQSGLITADKYATFFPLDKTKEAFETARDPHRSIKVIIEP